MKKLHLFLLLFITCAVSGGHAFGQSDRLPAVTVNNPTVYQTGYLGFVGGGIAFQSSARVNPRNDWKDPDFNAALYAGLGDPEKSLGVGLAINLFGLSDDNGSANNFGESTIDIHLSRAITENIHIGAGIFNAIQRNAVHTNALRTYYAGVSGLFSLLPGKPSGFGHLALTAGIGNGKYQNREDYLDAENRGVNVYGSAALQLIGASHLIVEWAGSDLTVASSVFPLKKVPLHLIIGISDLNLDKQRYIAMISYAHFFGKAKWQGGRGLPTDYYPFSLAPQ